MQSAPGSTYISFLPPDIAYWHLIGRVEASDIKHIYAEQLKFTEGKSYILLLIDVSRLVHITPEARRVASEGPVAGAQAMPVRGNAVIGASFHFRVLGTLMHRAARVLTRSRDNPLHFVDTEAEGCAWLEQRRRELLSEGI
jgi:hypothetical protein